MNYVNRDVLQHGLHLGLPISGLINRSTGRTTSRVIAAIGYACANPGVWYQVHPHRDEPVTTRNAGAVAAQAQRIIDAIGLDKMAVRVQGHEYRVEIRSDFAEPLE